MSTPTKQVPAPVKAPASAAPAAKKERVKRPPVTIDFASVTPDTAPDVHHLRNSQLDKTPVLDWVRASRNEGIQNGKEGAAKKVTVPASQADGLESLLRQAASRLKVGIKIETKVSGDTATVSYQAKNKRVNKVKASA